LPEIKITGTHFISHSKGKDIEGTLPATALKAIKAAALDGKKPFAGLKANTLEHKVARAIKKLYQSGKVKAAYSCHDLRHFYAVTEYKKDRDTHCVQKFLDHASIQVTKTYLKSLKVDL
jgi:integrase